MPIKCFVSHRPLFHESESVGQEKKKKKRKEIGKKFEVWEHGS